MDRPLSASIRSRLPWLTVNLGTTFLAAATVAVVSEDLAAAAVSAVRGSIDAARNVGVDAEKAASAVATGAAEAAYDVSDASGDAVRDTVTGTVQGVRVVVESVTSDADDAKKEARS